MTLAQRETIWGRISSRAADRERTRLLQTWRRPPGLARLVAEIDSRRLAALLSLSVYDPVTIRAELLAGAVVDVYAFGPEERRARGYIEYLRRDGMNIGASGRGRFKLLPKGARRSRSPKRAALRERLLAGETVRYEGASERVVLYGLTRALRREGYRVVCHGRGTRSYQVVGEKNELDTSREGTRQDGRQ